MDALSDVLKSVHLEGAVYVNAEFTAPWCVSAKFGLATVRAHLAGADHVVFFHYLTEGNCKVKLVDGSDTLDASAGDLILFLNEDRHLLGSDLQLVPVETARLIDADAAAQGDLIQLRHGGGGAATRFVCGYIACSQSLCRPLLEALPRVLRIPIGDRHAGTLLRELLRAGVSESLSSRPGAESVLAKLSELMFVEAMRRYVEDLPPEGRGWLAGVRDPQIGRTLALLHGDPARAWTVDALARRVALSRSALAERFATLVGEPPMKYLKRWRLALAAQALRAGNETVGAVAELSGYESEAAFTRAFKSEFGLPPATWRRNSVRPAVEA
jgi:AraC family transcriptional regulator, alkane utilization regulator